MIAPFVLSVLIRKLATQHDTVLEALVFVLLKSDLGINKHLYKFKLFLNALNFCVVSVHEIVGREVKSWSSRHKIGDNLHELLLI